MSRKVAAIITAITGDRVIIGEEELNHAIKEHFSMLPKYIVLELNAHKGLKEMKT